MAKEFIFYLHT